MQDYKIYLPVENTEIAKVTTYSEFVKTLAKKMPTHIEDLVHCALGICGEGGELGDAIKKTYIYSKPLDRENVVDEIGDLLFYISHLMTLLNISDKEVMDHNVAKLSKRYAAGYSDAAAQLRADKQTETIKSDLTDKEPDFQNEFNYKGNN